MRFSSLPQASGLGPRIGWLLNVALVCQLSVELARAGTALDSNYMNPSRQLYNADLYMEKRASELLDGPDSCTAGQEQLAACVDKLAVDMELKAEARDGDQFELSLGRSLNVANLLEARRLPKSGSPGLAGLLDLDSTPANRNLVQRSNKLSETGLEQLMAFGVDIPAKLRAHEIVLELQKRMKAAADRRLAAAGLEVTADHAATKTHSDSNSSADTHNNKPANSGQPKGFGGLISKLGNIVTGSRVTHLAGVLLMNIEFPQGVLSNLPLVGQMLVSGHGKDQSFASIVKTLVFVNRMLKANGAEAAKEPAEGQQQSLQLQMGRKAEAGAQVEATGQQGGNVMGSLVTKVGLAALQKVAVLVIAKAGVKNFDENDVAMVVQSCAYYLLGQLLYQKGIKMPS